MRTETIDALTDFARANPDVMLLTADLGYSVLERFAEALPAQYVNVGVCEQAMVGIAAGLALSGRRVVLYSIANFLLLKILFNLIIYLLCLPKKYLFPLFLTVLIFQFLKFLN